MTLYKPNFSNPDYNMPDGFATTNAKAPFEQQDIIDGYGTIGSLGLIPKGANYNHTIDLMFKWFTYLDNIVKISSGDPNSVVVADIGALCLDNINGKVYKKKSGTGNTGWVDLEAGVLPIGSGCEHYGDNLPNGFLWQDGSSYNTTDYPLLFAEIGYKYGNDNGKFRVPDRRKRVGIGLDATDTDFDTLGKTGGFKSIQLTLNQIPAHNHTATNTTTGDHLHTATTSSNGDHSHILSISNAGNHTHTATSASAGNHTHTATNSSAGSHTHTVSISTDGGHVHTIVDNGHAHNYQHIAAIGGNALWIRTDYDDNNNWTIKTTDLAFTGITINPAGNHTHTATINTVVDHTHTITVTSTGNHTHGVTVDSVADHTHILGISNSGNHTHTLTTNTTGSHTHAISVNNTGGNEAHSNLQPYIVCRYIIRVF